MDALGKALDDVLRCDLDGADQLERKSENSGQTERLEQAMRAAAELFLSGWTIVAAQHNNERRFKPLEIEFYVHGAPNLHDPFTHLSEGLDRRLVWHFLKIGSSFKGGSYKGINLAFGRSDGPLHAGLLIRSLQDASNAQTIVGPSLVVDELLRATGASSIADLVHDHWNGDLSPIKPSIARRSALFLEPMRSEYVQIWTSPRVGLNLRSADPLRIKFIVAPFRFVADPPQIHKGRVHTVVGLFMRHLSQQSRPAADAVDASNSPTDGETFDDWAARIVGIRPSRVQLIREAFERGMSRSHCIDQYSKIKSPNSLKTSEIFGACYQANSSHSHSQELVESTLTRKRPKMHDSAINSENNSTERKLRPRKSS